MKVIVNIFSIILLVQLFVCYEPAESKDINDLLSKMTNEQKCGQMTQLTFDVFKKNPSPSDPSENPIDMGKLREGLVKNQIGSILNTMDNTAQLAQTWQTIIKTILDVSMNETNLGIPTIYGIDSIHGATYIRESTLFPQPISMAASFNPEIAYRVGAITAQETRAVGIPWNFNPVLDVARQPLWSRVFETYGEDPFLALQMGDAYIRGHQGSSLKDKNFTAACLKHYIGYSVPFSGRDRTTAYIPDNLLREVFLPPFQAGVNAGAKTVMINSGDVNGVPGHANDYYINGILKGELGFKGFVVSDWEDVVRLHVRDRVASTPEEAVRIAVMAGVDMSMVPYDYSFYEHCVNLTKKDQKFLDRVNDANRRILTVKDDLGLFDSPYPDAKDLAKIGTAESEAFNLEAARESVILAKNENNLLPLKKDARILVTGPTSDLLRVLNGAWSYTWQGDCEKCFQEFGRKKFTVKEALKAKASVEVSFSQGATFTQLVNLNDTVNAAKNNDVIVICIGEDTYTESPGIIEDLLLPDAQFQLADELFKQVPNKKYVVIYLGGRPRVMTEIAQRADAVLIGFLPGNRGAEAIADILYGDYNPNAKLPLTYPISPSGLNTYDYHPLEEFELNYYHYLFRFGHGLSYTKFEYSNLMLSAPQVLPSKNDEDVLLTAKVTVKNVGTREGKETVLLYLGDLVASISRPVRQLKGFKKISLKANEAQTVTFDIKQKDVMFYDVKNTRIYEFGAFNVSVANLNRTFGLVDKIEPNAAMTTSALPKYVWLFSSLFSLLASRIRFI